MAKTPLISLIVPVYNVKEFLGECVESLINQSYKNLEILLVDDGSSDGSGELCDEFAMADERVRVIHKLNGGQASARNDALDVCKGEFVTFIDSDDVVNVQMVEILYKALSQNDTRISLCTYKAFRNHTELQALQNVINTDCETEILSQEKVFEASLGGDSFFSTCVWRALFGCEIFDDLRFPAGEIYEDVAVWFEIFNASKSACVRTPLYFYRIRDGSTVNSFAQKHLAAIKNVRIFSTNVARAYPALAPKARKIECDSALDTAFNIIRSRSMEFETELNELHSFVRKNLNLTYFLIPNKLYKVVMMILFYISPKLLRAFYKAVKAVR